MRILAGLLCLAPAVGLADDFTLRADVATATIYANVAQITRLANIELPAGAHRIIVPLVDRQNGAPINVDFGAGVTLKGIRDIQDIVLGKTELDSRLQSQARTALEVARKTLTDLQFRQGEAQAQVDAIAAQVSFLNSLSGAQIDETPQAGDLSQLLSTIGTEMRTALLDLQEARVAVRDLEEEVQEARSEVIARERVLARLAPFSANASGLEFSVTVESAGERELEMTYFTQGGWAPVYEARLTTGDDPNLSLSRQIRVRQNSQDYWDDIELILSTADPSRALAETDVFPSPARIADPQQRRETLELESGAFTADMSRAAESILEAEVIETAGVEFNGLSVTYVFPQDVSLASDQQSLLAFDMLNFTPELSHLATPRFDEVAYLNAEIKNDTGEPILPGEIAFYRDGDFIGGSYLEAIPATATTDLGFGPLDHLALSWRVLRKNEGDAGFITRSDTRDETVEFTVENLSTESQELRAIYAVPFSQQEDLDVDVTMSPQPDETDIDQKQGVHGWDFNLAPGEKQVVTLRMQLDWPEGQLLQWRP